MLEGSPTPAVIPGALPSVTGSGTSATLAGHPSTIGGTLAWDVQTGGLGPPVLKEMALIPAGPLEASPSGALASMESRGTPRGQSPSDHIGTLWLLGPS